MRRSIALGALLMSGISPLLIQCKDEARYGEETANTGKLSLPLEAVGQSGNIYRLRDAVFLVERRVGNTSGPSNITTVSTGDSFGSGGFAGATGDTGDFGGVGGSGVGGSGATGGTGATGDSGGNGGSGAIGGTGGTGASGNTGGDTGGDTGDSGSASGVGGGGDTGDFGFSAFSTSGFSTTAAGFGGGGGDEFELETILFGEDNPFDAELIARLRSGDYRITLQPDWIMERIKPNGQTDFVQSDLLSSDTQFFEIFSNNTSFVFYEFLVDGDQIIFGREGELVVGISVQEVNDHRQSLIETSLDAVAQFSLEDVLDALGLNAGQEANGQALYHQIIDSYASAPNGRDESAVHCGDENPNGPPTLNGYSILCDRREAEQFDNLGSWFATAIVNRIDLAPANGAHCGQQRIIFANNEPIGNGRMFMIIEPQIPNPSPELGVEGCRPIAELWRSLEDVDDPVLRGLILNDAFIGGGLPGIGPFLNASRITAGTGQIRTNNFNHFLWTLREFKLVDDEGAISARPFPTAEAPHGELWNDTVDLAAGEACRANFLQAIEGLFTDNPAKMAFIVDPECKDSESPNDFFTQNYPSHLAEGSGEFEAQLDERLEGTGLNAFDIAQRAQFAGSCIGCHEEAVGSFLGNGVNAPFSNGFVHVDEQFTESCNGEECFPISQALRDVFLPNRAEVMDQLLGTGQGGAGGEGGESGEGGFGGNGPTTVTVTTTGFGTTGSGGFGGSGMMPGDPAVASAELTPEELYAEDEALKKGWGDETLGGQPAKVSH